MSSAASSALILRGGTILTVDPQRRVLAGDLLIEDGRIAAIVGPGESLPTVASPRVLDVRGCAVMPGLVQAHTHLCQTLCRGAADDLPLLAWLRERVWPYEAALDERAMRAATRLAIAELLLSGTTAILDMGTVRETDALADELARSGLRATLGKAMMDTGDGVPPRMRETTRASLDESDALARRWSGAAEDRLRYAYAPRFVLSCTEALLREVAARLRAGARLHTHASEQLDECALVRAERGADNIAYFGTLGLVGPRTALAHCVHPTLDERSLLARSGAHVVHCPSSNLKLGSGIAPIPEMIAEGISVALGADGAPCNNNLDGFLELRLAALLHKPRAGTHAMPAPLALELATLNGARAIGRADEIGSLEVGKRADLIVVDLETLHGAPSPEPVSHVVYAAQSRDVRHVFVDGRQLVENGRLTERTGLERARVIADARAEGERIRNWL
jgi:cytosine/adenosine deaminase-related metal-dependent hydrolase